MRICVPVLISDGLSYYVYVYVHVCVRVFEWQSYISELASEGGS